MPKEDKTKTFKKHSLMKFAKNNNPNIAQNESIQS